MARVARAGRFFGFGLAIYLLSYLYIYDIGVWTPPPAPAPRNKGTAGEFLQLSFRFPWQGAQTAFVLWFAHCPTTTRPTHPWSLLCVLFAASGSRFGCPSPCVTRVHTVCSHLGPLVWGCWVRVVENLFIGNLPTIILVRLKL